MNKEAKQQLAEMQLLMERMDSHMTKSQVEKKTELIRESIFEMNNVGRIQPSSIEELFTNYEIKPGDFVSIGYIKPYPLRKVYPTSTEKKWDNGTSDYKTYFQKVKSGIDPNSPVYGKLDAMEKNPEFSNPTGKPYAKLNSMSNTGFNSVIKSCHYLINWQSRDGYSNTYTQQKVEPVNALRARFSIDKDIQYPDGDWRKKYAGTRDDEDENDPKNDKYISLSDTAPLYSYTKKDGTTSKYLRFIRQKANQDSTYYLVDNNGDIDDVEKSLAKLMSNITDKSFKKKTDYIDDQTSQEEAEFLTELEKILAGTRFKFNTMLTQNIAFIIGAGTNKRTQQKEKIRWVNKDIDLDVAGLNPNTKTQIIQREYDAAMKDLQTV